jgi:tetratricopeptide (TPR) repeat protein
MMKVFIILGLFFAGTQYAQAQSAAALAQEAQTLLEAGNHDAALAKADAAITADAKFGEAYFRRGKIKSAKANDTEAVADYRKAIELGYATGELYRLKAMSEHLLKNDAEGCKDFDKAIGLGDAISEDFKARFCK